MDFQHITQATARFEQVRLRGGPSDGDRVMVSSDQVEFTTRHLGKRQRYIRTSGRPELVHESLIPRLGPAINKRGHRR